MPAKQEQAGEGTRIETEGLFSWSEPPLVFSPPSLRGLSGCACSPGKKARLVPDFADREENADCPWIV
jgi:hypothetical protein